MLENNPLNSETSVVAFIDILGASELIMREKNDETLRKVHNCYQEAIKDISQRFPNNLPIPKTNIFSDNIVASLPCSNVDNDEHFASFYSIIAFCSCILTYFWTEGLLVRGGITIDSFFSDDLMVWGKGLVTAHELESSIAIYPRIIIDPNCSDIFIDLIQPKKSQLICNDYDGIFFVDPFPPKHKEKWQSTVYNLAEENWERIQNTNPKNLKILQKLQWLQKYFDSKLND